MTLRIRLFPLYRRFFFVIERDWRNYGRVRPVVWYLRKSLLNFDLSIRAIRFGIAAY